jgi:hypothetical protein
VVTEPSLRWSDLEPEEQAFLKEAGEPIGGHPACPPPELLRVFHGRVLSETLASRIEEHVERCQVCQLLSRDFSEVDAPLRPEEEARIRARVFKPVSRCARWLGQRVFWQLLPALAAVALIVAMVWVNTARQNRARRIASSPFSQPPSLLVSPVFALEKPPAILNVPLLMRGVSRGRQAPAAALFFALKPYQSGNYAEAMERLEPLMRKYPQNAEIPFYLGASALLEGNNAAAVENLNRAVALARGLLARESQWYLAVADVRAGQTAKDGSILQRLCESAGAYQKRACAGFANLSSRRFFPRLLPLSR